MFNACSSLKHTPQGSPLPGQSCWGGDAQLPWPCGVGVPLLQPLGSLRAHWHCCPRHTGGILMGSSPLAGFAMYNFNRAGCFWGTVNEPISITVILQQDWSSHSKQCLQKTVQMQIRPQHPEILEREKLCSPITQTHLTGSWNKAQYKFLPDRVHPGLLLSRGTKQAFLCGNTLLLCLLKTLKSHTLISYSMQACEPLHLDVGGKIYPWHKNQSH